MSEQHDDIRDKSYKYRIEILYERDCRGRESVMECQSYEITEQFLKIVGKYYSKWLPWKSIEEFSVWSIDNLRAEMKDMAEVKI